MLINGKKVKKARKNMGKKIAMLAGEIDMSAPWLYALEKAEKQIDVKVPVADAIAKALKVHKVDLTGAGEGIE